jgi:hypothetical protein
LTKPKDGHEELAASVPISDTKQITVRIGTSKSGSGYVDIRQMYKNEPGDSTWSFGKGLRFHEEKLRRVIEALEDADQKMTGWYDR